MNPFVKDIIPLLKSETQSTLDGIRTVMYSEIPHAIEHLPLQLAYAYRYRLSIFGVRD